MKLDDLEVGQYVTVVKGPMRASINIGFNECSTAREDKSYQGRVLRILAVNLPFVAVEQVGIPKTIGNIRTGIDTRDYELRPLSDEYVYALHPGEGENYEDA